MATRWMCALLALVGCSLAQPAAVTVPGPDRLPPDTWVLVNWHGVANAKQVRNANPVMRLWNDPQFASARDQIITRIAGSVGRDTSPDQSRAQIDDVLSVLENPAVLGGAGNPMAPGNDAVHVFAVLNRKGKETEWTRLHKNDKPAANAEVSSFAFHGVQIRKTVKTTMRTPTPGSGKPEEPPKPKISTSFEASLGDHELFSDGQAVMESLITQLQGGAPATDSLLTDPVYRRAQRFRAEGPLLEVFVRVPDLSKIPLPPSPRLDTQAVVRELHPERMQGLWLSAGMRRDRMVIRGALLGDTSPGSLLDLIGGNVTEFQTLAVAPVAESFAAFRLDLPALYATVLRAVKAGMPPDRGAATSMMIDSMVASATGMRVTELLGLFTGEIGVTSNGGEAAGAALPAVVMLPVTGGEQLLGLLRKVAGRLFTGEEKVSAATVVQLGPLPEGAALNAGAESKGPFFFAASPNLVAISQNRPELAGVLARNAAGAASPAGSLAADATFRSARKTLPTRLNGISYTDFSRTPWETRTAAMRQQMELRKQQALDRADRVEKGEGDSPPDPARAAQLRLQAESTSSIEQLLVEILPLTKKHLKISIGGSWKAGDGVYFDSYVN